MIVDMGPVVRMERLMRIIYLAYPGEIMRNQRWLTFR